MTITPSGGTAFNAPAGSYTLMPSAATATAGGTFLATNYTVTITQAGLVSPTGRLGRDSIPATVTRSGLSSPKAATALDAPTGRTGLVSPTEKAGKS